MCLYLRDKVEHIATSDIYVWKGLVSGIGCYYSPIFNYRYDLGETYKSYLDKNNNSTCVTIGLHSIGYNIKISNPYAGRYNCYGNTCNRFGIQKPIDTIRLFIIPKGSHYYTDGYFYASDTLNYLELFQEMNFLII